MKQLAIIGTTASGKSDLAIELGMKFGGVILSLDSLCIYKEISIASAKPSSDELGLIKHFGIDLIYPNESFNAGEFAKEYQKAKEFAIAKNAPLFIVGGTGFYLKSLISGMIPHIPECENRPSNDEIYALITQIDAEFGAKFSQNDTYRLKKWYSIYKFSGEIPSKFLRENTMPPVISELKIFDILREKSEINDRIAKRTQKMLEMGLVDEAKFLLEKYGDAPKPFKSIGLKETFLYLGGEISFGELGELITLHTIQLAKRQRTFNKSQFERTFGDMEFIKNEIIKFLSPKTS